MPLLATLRNCKVKSELLNYLFEIPSFYLFVSFPFSHLTLLLTACHGNLRIRKHATSRKRKKYWQVWIITFRWSRDSYFVDVYKSAMGHADAWTIMAVNGAVINHGIVTFVSRWIDVNLMKLNCAPRCLGWFFDAREKATIKFVIDERLLNNESSGLHIKNYAFFDLIKPNSNVVQLIRNFYINYSRSLGRSLIGYTIIVIILKHTSSACASPWSFLPATNNRTVLFRSLKLHLVRNKNINRENFETWIVLELKGSENCLTDVC